MKLTLDIWIALRPLEASDLWRWKGGEVGKSWKETQSEGDCETSTEISSNNGSLLPQEWTVEEVADWLWNLEGDRHRRLGSGGVFVFFSFRFKKGRLFAESSSFKSNSIEVLVKYVFLHIFFLWQLWSQKDGLKTFIRLFFTNQCFYPPGTLTFFLDENERDCSKGKRGPRPRPGFLRYVQAFKENLIDGMSLETLTLGDLKELGVTELRNRKVGDEDCWRMEGEVIDFVVVSFCWGTQIDS